MGTATVDFKVLANGVVKYTAAPVDALKNPATLPSGVVPVWTSSDPATLAVAADTTDVTGLTAIGKPVKLGAGVVATITATLPDGTSITGSATPVDVVAGPVAGFVVAEA